MTSLCAAEWRRPWAKTVHARQIRNLVSIAQIAGTSERCAALVSPIWAWILCGFNAGAAEPKARDGSESFHDSPLNTQLTGGGVTYDVCSPGTTVQKHTTISRGGIIVATVEWHSIAPNVMHFGGEERKVSEFLPRARFSGPNRCFVADDETYEWEPVTGSPISISPLGDKTYESQRTFLSLRHDKKILATMERHSRGGSTLHVDEEARSILDHIVVSLVLMWRLMQPTYTSHGGPRYSFGSGAGNADGDADAA